VELYTLKQLANDTIEGGFETSYSQPGRPVDLSRTFYLVRLIKGNAGWIADSLWQVGGT
jgi:hypothetical protein